MNGKRSLFPLETATLPFVQSGCSPAAPDWPRILFRYGERCNIRIHPFHGSGVETTTQINQLEEKGEAAASRVAAKRFGEPLTGLGQLFGVTPVCRGRQPHDESGHAVLTREYQADPPSPNTRRDSTPRLKKKM